MKRFPLIRSLFNVRRVKALHCGYHLPFLAAALAIVFTPLICIHAEGEGDSEASFAQVGDFVGDWSGLYHSYPCLMGMKLTLREATSDNKVSGELSFFPLDEPKPFTVMGPVRGEFKVWGGRIYTLVLSRCSQGAGSIGQINLPWRLAWLCGWRGRARGSVHLPAALKSKIPYDID